MPATDSPNPLEYRHALPIEESATPQPGFLMHASVLISIFAAVGLGMFACAVGMRDARSRYELVLPCLGLALAVAILVLEAGSYYLHSIVASVALGTAYLLPPVYFLHLVYELPAGIHSPDFPILMFLVTPPTTLCLVAATAHLLWSRRLHHWKRATRDAIA